MTIAKFKIHATQKCVRPMTCTLDRSSSLSLYFFFSDNILLASIVKPR